MIRSKDVTLEEISGLVVLQECENHMQSDLSDANRIYNYEPVPEPITIIMVHHQKTINLSESEAFEILASADVDIIQELFCEENDSPDDITSIPSIRHPTQFWGKIALTHIVCKWTSLAQNTLNEKEGILQSYKKAFQGRSAKVWINASDF